MYEFKGIPPNEREGSVHDTDLHGKIRVIKYVNSTQVHIRFIDTNFEKMVGWQEIGTKRLSPVIRPKVTRTNRYIIGSPMKPQNDLQITNDLSSIFEAYQDSKQHTETLKARLKSIIGEL